MTDLQIVSAVWNIIVFSVFGVDKYKAVHNRWRISEATLILMCFAMGGVGGFLGMYVWHHKTLKWKFRILVPLAIVCNAVTYKLFDTFVIV